MHDRIIGRTVIVVRASSPLMSSSITENQIESGGKPDIALTEHDLIGIRKTHHCPIMSPSLYHAISSHLVIPQVNPVSHAYCLSNVSSFSDISKMTVCLQFVLYSLVYRTAEPMSQLDDKVWYHILLPVFCFSGGSIQRKTASFIRY